MCSTVIYDIMLTGLEEAMLMRNSYLKNVQPFTLLISICERR